MFRQPGNSGLTEAVRCDNHLMRAHGSDRLRIREDGTVELLSKHPKDGWSGGSAKTATRSARPGTAVLCDDGCWEVVAAEQTDDGVLYVLSPWRDENAMRLTQRYDFASERARGAERLDLARRTKHRRASTVLGVFTGHLPAPVQRSLANELGVDAPLLTIVSGAAEWVFAATVALRFASSKLASTATPPLWLILLAAFACLDGTVRAGVAWLESKPLGSLPGLLGYAVFYLLHPERGRLLPPLDRGKGYRFDSPAPEISEETRLNDTLKLWEPLLTLLSPADQRTLERKFGFDYRHRAVAVTLVVLVFSTAGVVSSAHTLSVTPRLSALLSLLTAGALAGEQLIRLSILRKRPAASILRFAIRPLVASLF